MEEIKVQAAGVAGVRVAPTEIRVRVDTKPAAPPPPPSARLKTVFEELVSGFRAQRALEPLVAEASKLVAGRSGAASIALARPPPRPAKIADTLQTLGATLFQRRIDAILKTFDASLRMKLGGCERLATMRARVREQNAALLDTVSAFARTTIKDRFRDAWATRLRDVRDTLQEFAGRPLGLDVDELWPVALAMEDAPPDLELDAGPSLERLLEDCADDDEKRLRKTLCKLRERQKKLLDGDLDGIEELNREIETLKPRARHVAAPRRAESPARAPPSQKSRVTFDETLHFDDESPFDALRGGRALQTLVTVKVEFDIHLAVVTEFRRETAERLRADEAAAWGAGVAALVRHEDRELGRLKAELETELTRIDARIETVREEFFGEDAGAHAAWTALKMAYTAALDLSRDALYADVLRAMIKLAKEAL